MAGHIDPYLGYLVFPNDNVSGSALIKEVSRHKIFYIHCHGASSNVSPVSSLPGTPFLGFNIVDHKTVTPEDIVAWRKDNWYKLVFINACSSADKSLEESQGQNMCDAFNTQVYVGWNQKVDPVSSERAADYFFRYLDLYQTAGWAAKMTKRDLESGHKFTILKGKDMVVDLSDNMHTDWGEE